MERIFFSRNNFNVIYNIIGENIYKQYKYDIGIDKKYEEQIISTMRIIYDKRDKYSINYNSSTQNISNQLSKYVLKNVNDNISEYIKQNVIIKQNISKNKVDMRPKPSITNTIHDVNKRYEKLQNERSSMIKKEPENIPNFNDNIDENYKDVNVQYEMLSKRRNDELLNTNPDTQKSNLNTNPTLIEMEETNEIDLLNINDSIKNDSNDFMSSFDNSNIDTLDSQFGIFSNNTDLSNLKQKFEQTSIEDRLKEYENNRNIEIKITEVETEKTKSIPPIKSIHNNPIQFNDNNQVKQTLDDYYPKIEPTITPTQNKIYTLRKYNIIINSIDRQWWGEIIDGNIYPSIYENRYKYMVNFAPTSDTSVKVPIYINSKYKPPEFNELNTNGFNYNGKSYNSYNPDHPKGLIVDYVTQIFKGGNDGVSINNIIKNVVSVKLRRFVMPNNDLSYSSNITTKPISQLHSDGLETGSQVNNITPEPRYTTYYSGFKMEPYLFIHIDGFDSNIITTNHFNKSLFAKPHFDKDYKYSSDLNSCSYISRGWSYFKNDDGDYTEFRPAPLSEITKLSIEILRPDGTIYSDVKDNLQIKSIEFYDTTNTTIHPQFLKITLSGGDNDGWVHESYFNNGDKIIVKKLNWDRNSSTLWKDTWINTINDYLEKGANIVRWNNDTDEYEIKQNRFLNKILVPNPLLNLNNNGILEWNYNLYDQLPTVWTNPKIDVKGFLINYNLQHSLIMEVVVEETKNNIISEII